MKGEDSYIVRIRAVDREGFGRPTKSEALKTTQRFPLVSLALHPPNCTCYTEVAAAAAVLDAPPPPPSLSLSLFTHSHQRASPFLPLPSGLLLKAASPLSPPSPLPQQRAAEGTTRGLLTSPSPRRPLRPPPPLLLLPLPLLRPSSRPRPIHQTQTAGLMCGPPKGPRVKSLAPAVNQRPFQRHLDPMKSSIDSDRRHLWTRGAKCGR